MPEAAVCPFCPGADSVAVIEDNGYTGRQCARCGVIFVSPRPTEEEMQQIYEAGDAYLAPDFFLQTADSLSSRLEASRAVAQLKRHVRGGSLLEIGPGSGTFLAAARSAGFDPYGVELNPVQAAFIRERRHITCWESLEDASTQGPAAFDVVYHRDVISHFYDPVAEFHRLNALLAPGGFHVFHTGNFGDVAHRHFRRVKSFQYPDHLFFFSYSSLLALLERTGLELVETVRHSIRPESAVAAALTRVRGQAPTVSNGDDIVSTAPPTSPANHGKAGHYVREALDLGYWALRSTVGRAIVNDDDPQTMMIISRKRE